MSGDALVAVGAADALVARAREVLARLKGTADGIEEIVDVLPLGSLAEETHAADLVRELRRLVREGEAARKEIVAPVKARVRAVDAVFRAPRKRLEALEGRLRARLVEAQEARRRAQEEAAQAAREAAAREDWVAANAALANVPQEEGPEGTSTRWTWEVESADLRQVPEEYLVLDLPRVRAAIRDAERDGRAPEIPGVRFKRRAIVAVAS